MSYVNYTLQDKGMIAMIQNYIAQGISSNRIVLSLNKSQCKEVLPKLAGFGICVNTTLKFNCKRNETRSNCVEGVILTEDSSEILKAIELKAHKSDSKSPINGSRSCLAMTGKAKFYIVGDVIHMNLPINEDILPMVLNPAVRANKPSVAEYTKLTTYHWELLLATNGTPCDTWQYFDDTKTLKLENVTIEQTVQYTQRYSVKVSKNKRST